MQRFDRHNEIELNLLDRGSLTYIVGGRRVSIPAGRFRRSFGFLSLRGGAAAALRSRWTDRCCRERSENRVGQDRFRFVVRKGVFKSRFEGGLRRRICSGMDADALFPQSQMAEACPP
jgi:hypothetical protein